MEINLTPFFPFNDAERNDQDKPALQDFAKTIGKYHPNVLITVEGFTDAAGSRSYNRKLGMERAKTVRDFLVSSGMNADQVRAVSYGKNANRQVTKGATHAAGQDNRRVSLTVYSTGSNATIQSAS